MWVYGLLVIVGVLLGLYFKTWFVSYDESEENVYESEYLTGFIGTPVFESPYLDEGEYITIENQQGHLEAIYLHPNDIERLRKPLNMGTEDTEINWDLL